jgi:hypothetical protein
MWEGMLFNSSWRVERWDKAMIPWVAEARCFRLLVFNKENSSNKF